LRRYRIFSNGVEVGLIARNSVLEFKVPSGPTTIEARIDWGRSKPVVVNATRDHPVEIEVENNWGAILALWAVTFGRKSYLVLRPSKIV
jgi:hypothetical protein